MEYVIYKGKGALLYTLDESGGDHFVNMFSESALNGCIELPEEPCDLELFRDTMHEVLTEIIEKKRKK